MERCCYASVYLLGWACFVRRAESVLDSVGLRVWEGGVFEGRRGVEERVKVNGMYSTV